MMFGLAGLVLAGTPLRARNYLLYGGGFYVLLFSVIELGIIVVLLMGWEYAAAEFIGGPTMIIVVAVLFHSS